MDKMTMAQAAKALGITRKTLLITLVYHPELRPRTRTGVFNLTQVSQTLWSAEELERVRAHLTTRKRAGSAESTGEPTAKQAVDAAMPN